MTKRKLMSNHVGVNLQKNMSAFLISISFFLLFLDSVVYPGFVGKYILVDSKVFMVIALFILLSTRLKLLSVDPNNNSLFEFVLNVTYILMPILIFTYVFFSIIEAVHYNNYVLSVFHLHLNGLVYMPIFGLLILIINSRDFLGMINAGGLKLTYLFKSKRLFPVPKLGSVTVLLLYVFISYALISNISLTLDSLISRNIYVFTHLNNNYDQKMTYHWKNFYWHMLFVKNNTPQDSTIIIPPEKSPWLISGNPWIVRYFLYPRNIVQYENENLKIENNSPSSKDTYVLLSWGEWKCDGVGCNGWPKDKLNTKQIYIKKDNSQEVETILQDMEYDASSYENLNGLIKI